MLEQCLATTLWPLRAYKQHQTPFTCMDWMWYEYEGGGGPQSSNPTAMPVRYMRYAQSSRKLLILIRNYLFCEPGIVVMSHFGVSCWLFYRENCPNTSQNKKIAPRDLTETQIPPSTSPHINNSVVYFTKLINLLLYFTKQFSLLLYLTNSLSVFYFVSPIKIDCYFTSWNVSCCWSPHQ